MKADVINIIDKVSSALESYKAPFWALWQWAIQFSSGESPLRYSSVTGQEINNPSTDLDDESYDPTTNAMLMTAKDYYGGLFFPSHEPWSVVPTFIIDHSITPDIAEECNARIERGLNNPDSRWYEAREIFLDNYIRLGTGDLFAVETMNDECPFVIKSLGLWGMSIGRSMNEQHQVFNMTAQQIVDEFGEEKIKDNEAVWTAYMQYDVSQVFKVHHLIVRNNEYLSSATDGKRARPYVGFWYLEGLKPIDTIYYPEKPHCINRYSIRSGKVYGYSPLTDFKKSFQALEGIFFLCMSSAGKLADPRMGYFDMGSIGALELDSDAKYVPFSQGIVGSGSLPVFPIQDVGDITPLAQFIRPIISDGLRVGYKLDAMAEYSQKAGNPRTATEVLAMQNIKNKMIAPQVKKFAEQLGDFRRRVTMIVLRSMVRDGFIEDPKIRAAIERSDKALFDLEETSIVKRIIYSEKSEQFGSDLQLIAAAVQTQPSLMPAVDLYDSLTDVLEYGLMKLKDKADYEEKRSLAEMASMKQGIAAADGAAAQAKMLEGEAEGQ